MGRLQLEKEKAFLPKIFQTPSTRWVWAPPLSAGVRHCVSARCHLREVLNLPADEGDALLHDWSPTANRLALQLRASVAGLDDMVLWITLALMHRPVGKPQDRSRLGTSHDTKSIHGNRRLGVAATGLIETSPETESLQQSAF